VGQQRSIDQAERVVLFVKLKPPYVGKLRHGIECRIRNQIAKDLSRRHVPHYIFEVLAIPHNANGKKMEIQVKLLLCRGEAPAGGDAVEAAALAPYKKFYQMEEAAVQDRSVLSKM
jgi:acetoacetyl-CoA synthetase